MDEITRVSVHGGPLLGFAVLGVSVLKALYRFPLFCQLLICLVVKSRGHFWGSPLKGPTRAFKGVICIDELKNGAPQTSLPSLPFGGARRPWKGITCFHAPSTTGFWVITALCASSRPMWVCLFFEGPSKTICFCGFPFQALSIGTQKRA